MKKTILALVMILLCALLCSCTFNAYNYPNGHRYTAGGGAVQSRVENLDIDWIDGTVTIGCHDGSDVLLSERSGKALDRASELRWWLDGDTLYVKYAESGFGLSGNLNKALTVLLPRGLALDTLKVNVVSSDVTATDVTAARFELDTVSGDVQVDAAGMENVETDTVSGDVTLRFARAPESVEVDSVSGDVSVGLPEGAGCTLDTDTVSGNVRTGLQMEQRDGRYMHGDGSCRISVETVSGDIRLDTLK